MNTRAFIILAGLAAAAWSVAHWRKAVKLALVLVILEGAIRKWLFPGAQDLVYFGKDVLLLGAYVGVLRDRPRFWQRLPATPGLNALLLLGVIYGALQVFNPWLPNLLVGMLGFKAYFLYIPLLFLLPEVFPDDRSLAVFLRRYIFLAIPVGMLALAQFLSPASSPLNTYARTATDLNTIATFGTSTFVRVTSTFSYITGYSTYLVVVAFLALSVLATTRWRLRGNWVSYAAFAATLMGMFMTGSRGPVLMLGLLFPLYWWLAVARERGGGRTMARLLLALGLVAGFIGFTAPDAVEAFYGRAAGSTDVTARMISPFIQPFRILDSAGLFGFGIGATHQAAGAITPGMRQYSWIPVGPVEAETGRVMLELGGLGFLLIYAVRIYLIWFSFQQVFLLRSTFHRAVATASLLFFLAQLPGAVVFNVTADLYYWFFAGLLLLVIHLDRAAVRRTLATAAAESTSLHGSSGGSVQVPQAAQALAHRGVHAPDAGAGARTAPISGDGIGQGQG